MSACLWVCAVCRVRHVARAPMLRWARFLWQRDAAAAALRAPPNEASAPASAAKAMAMKWRAACVSWSLAAAPLCVCANVTASCTAPPPPPPAPLIIRPRCMGCRVAAWPGPCVLPAMRNTWPSTPPPPPPPARAGLIPCPPTTLTSGPRWRAWRCGRWRRTASSSSRPCRWAGGFVHHRARVARERSCERVHFEGMVGCVCVQRPGAAWGGAAVTARQAVPQHTCSRAPRNTAPPAPLRLQGGAGLHPLPEAAWPRRARQGPGQGRRLPQRRRQWQWRAAGL